MKKDGGGGPSDADYNGDNDENTVQLEVGVVVVGVLKPSDDNDTASLDLCWIIQRVKLG